MKHKGVSAARSATDARAEGAHWINAADQSSMAAAEYDRDQKTERADALANAQVEALIAIYWELRHGNDVRAAQHDAPPHAG